MRGSGTQYPKLLDEETVLIMGLDIEAHTSLLPIGHSATLILSLHLDIQYRIFLLDWL